MAGVKFVGHCDKKNRSLFCSGWLISSDRFPMGIAPSGRRREPVDDRREDVGLLSAFWQGMSHRPQSGCYDGSLRVNKSRPSFGGDRRCPVGTVLFGIWWNIRPQQAKPKIWIRYIPDPKHRLKLSTLNQYRESKKFNETQKTVTRKSKVDFGTLHILLHVIHHDLNSEYSKPKESVYTKSFQRFIHNALILNYI